jgi:hypothetical protein
MAQKLYSLENIMEIFRLYSVVQKRAACRQAGSKTDFRKVILHAYNFLSLTKEGT